ncbi:hypothetical protein [Arenimonas sp. MALMAid1274]|uniref:hypothetical protein n=1 Tax=Arenimonas sp. MALMAid1274 TaxID=3411630 RepID=UPI003BA23434
MRHLLVPLALLVPFAAFADTTAQRLAAFPEASVVEERCLVRGAMTVGDTPLPHATLDLVNRDTGDAHPVKTGKDGVYEATVPAGAVYRERLTSDTLRRSRTTGSLIPPQVETPWVMCRVGVVEVGEAVRADGGAQ